MNSQRYIAMWSGPRNISTTMMRAWGSRDDAIVCDEPFYAHYLRETGFSYHPGYQEILDHHETDWRQVVEQLTSPLPEGKTTFYQKHMAHHMLGDIPFDWTDKLTNAFLIRDPKEMLLSLLEFFPEPKIEETGLPQQLELFHRVEQRLGRRPPVVDARDVLLNPQGVLCELCRQVEVPFDEKMLGWLPGVHETDGIWAKYWYDKVAITTSFGLIGKRRVRFLSVSLIYSKRAATSTMSWPNTESNCPRPIRSQSVQASNKRDRFIYAAGFRRAKSRSHRQYQWEANPSG